MTQQEKQEYVRFSSTGASVAGAISGVVIAIGVPWVVLTHGQTLPGPSQTALVWVGVILGGVLSLMSAFFGLVMPSQVGGENGNPWGGNPWQQQQQQSGSKEAGK